MKLFRDLTAFFTLFSVFLCSARSDASIVLSVDLDRNLDGIQDRLDVGPSFQGQGAIIIELTDDTADVGLTGFQFDLNFSGEVALGEASFEFVDPDAFSPPPPENRAFERRIFQTTGGTDFASLGRIEASDEGLLGYAVGATLGFQQTGFRTQVLDFNFSVPDPQDGTTDDISFSNFSALSAIRDMDDVVQPRFDFILRNGTINVTAIPEPSSISLLSMGLGCFACQRRRRRRRGKA